MQEILLKVRYFERLKKVNFIFFFNPVPFNGQHEKKEIGTNDQSLFRLQTKFRKVRLLALYYLTKLDDIR